MKIDKFTQKAQEAISEAQDIAVSEGHQQLSGAVQNVQGSHVTSSTLDFFLSQSSIFLTDLY
jgi:hypothetical protein